MDRLLQSRDTANEDDFYELLGCDESSTAEQIATEYKQLARKHHPDKKHNEEDKDEAEKYFMRLEQAKNVLLDKDLRSKYDQWRSGGFRTVVSFNDWQAMQSRVHSSIHWASSKQKVQSLPEPEAKTPSHGPPEANTPTVSHEPPVEESSNKDMMSGPSKKLRADPEGVDKLATLHQFRRGSDESSSLSQFRNYRL